MSKAVITTARAAPQAPVAYSGVFGSGTASRPFLPSKPAPVPSFAAPRDSHVARGAGCSRPHEVSSWEGVFSDDNIRAHADG